MLQRLLLSAAFGAAAVSSAVAAENETPAQVPAATPPAAQAQPGGDAAAQAQARLDKAHNLLGAQVGDAQGQALGELKEIVIDIHQGRIAYGVLDFDAEGLGDKRFAVPWQALRMQPQAAADAGAPDAQADAKARLALSIPREKFEQAQGFDDQQWPDMADPQWNTQVHQRYGYEPYWRSQRSGAQGDQPQAADAAAGQQPAQVAVKDPDKFWLNRVSKLLGTNIQKPDGGNLAELEEIMIDSREGRIAYAILEFGGTLGMGDKLAAIPWMALNLDPQKETLSLAATEEDLQQVAFAKDQWPAFDRQFGQSAARAFEQRPYWEVYGYPDAAQTEMEH